MLETPNPSAYREIVSGLRSGAFKQEAEFFHSVLESTEVNPASGKTEVKDRVAVISFTDELTKYSGLCNFGADAMISKIIQYNADPTIKAFIFKMDGPGGNASVIPMFQELKKVLKKPVISLVDKACSLHYYIAAILSERIIMSNDFTAECGSIGAIIMFEKPEREMVIVRPPQSFDKGQEMINAFEGNYELLEKRLIPLAERFMADVKAARPQVKDEVLHGKVLYAKDAIAAGLADSIGNMDTAYKVALSLAELNNVKS